VKSIKNDWQCNLYKVTAKHSRAMPKATLVAAFSALLTACGGDSASQSFTVSATTGSGGSVSPASLSVQGGQTATFNIIADTGYDIASVSGCNGSLVSNTYTTGAITSACSVNASFNLTLAAPQNLVVTSGNAQLNFSWNSVAGATSYNLFYDTEAKINPIDFAASNTGKRLQNVTSPYTLTGVENGVTYYAIVTAAVGAAESAASTEVSGTPAIPFVAIGGLNDTGIDWCTDGNTSNLDCPVGGFVGSDGDHGRDASARAGTLDKVGGGSAGFDYSKIGANGQALAAQNVAWDENGSEAAGSRWSCVRDNVTGLIWEVKVDNGDLHDKDHTYSWYNPDSSRNGGHAGMQSGGQCSGSDCDTAAFVQAVNQKGLCGAQDWRMPTELELIGIVNNGRVNPAIDTGYFPNTPSDKFWSSTAYSINSVNAWNVNFSTGSLYVYNSAKSDNYHVRLVRAAQ
jgi:hypothetical protein